MAADCAAAVNAKSSFVFSLFPFHCVFFFFESRVNDDGGTYAGRNGRDGRA